MLPNKLDEATPLPESAFYLYEPQASAKSLEAEKLLNELKSFAAYDICNGGFVATVRRKAISARPGEALGTPGGKDNAYFSIYLAGEKRSVQRLVWLWFNGYFPDERIDHIDGNTFNNRVTNLRSGKALNQRNIAMSSRNTSGYSGVSWHKGTQKWKAQIAVNHTSIYLGVHDNILDAVAAREKFIKDHLELGFTERHGK